MTEALEFSFASDIVELVVLTLDENFLQTLREAVGGARRVWHVPSADKVGDLLIAGEVGILVLDAPTLDRPAAGFIGQIKRQFPDLVVLVAGSRDDEAGIAGLISAGIVYRFIHKPMSPARARLFADAAVRKFHARRPAPPPPPVEHRERSNRGWLLGAAGGILVSIVAATWAVHTGTDEMPGGGRSAGADRAPSGDATEPVQAAGLIAVREQFLMAAENALLEEHLDEASADIEAARRSGAEGGRIALLTARLNQSREQAQSAQTLAHARAYAHADEDRIARLTGLAAQRMSQGHLIDPQGDSARDYLREALRTDSNSGAVMEAQRALAMRLLSEAHGAIDRRDFAGAAAWLEAAKGFATPANIETAQSWLDIARGQTAP